MRLGPVILPEDRQRLFLKAALLDDSGTLLAESSSAEYTFREIRIKSLDKRCKVDNPREYRFSSHLPTKAPDFVSTAVEPSPWFTPLLAGADTLQQVFFTSESFDTLTDQAGLTLFLVKFREKFWRPQIFCKVLLCY